MGNRSVRQQFDTTYFAWIWGSLKDLLTASASESKLAGTAVPMAQTVISNGIASEGPTNEPIEKSEIVCKPEDLTRLNSLVQALATELMTVIGHSPAFVRQVAFKMCESLESVTDKVKYLDLSLSANPYGRCLVLVQIPSSPFADKMREKERQKEELEYLALVAMGSHNKNLQVTADLSQVVFNFWKIVIESPPEEHKAIVRYCQQKPLLWIDLESHAKVYLDVDGISGCVQHVTSLQLSEVVKSALAVMSASKLQSTVSWESAYYCTLDELKVSAAFASESAPDPDKSYFHPISNEISPHPAVALWRPRTLATTLSRLKSEIANSPKPLPEKLQRALQMYSLGLDSSSVDNSFILLWSSLECLAVAEKGAHDIAMIDARQTTPRSNGVAASVRALVGPAMALGSLGRRVLAVATSIAVIADQSTGSFPQDSKFAEVCNCLNEFKASATQDNLAKLAIICMQKKRDDVIGKGPTQKEVDGWKDATFIQLRQLFPALCWDIAELRKGVGHLDPAKSNRSDNIANLCEKSVKMILDVFRRSHEMTDLQLDRLQGIRSRLIHGGPTADTKLMTSAWWALEWYVGKTLAIAMRLFEKNVSQAPIDKLYTQTSQPEFSEYLDREIRQRFALLKMSLVDLQKRIDDQQKRLDATPTGSKSQAKPTLPFDMGQLFHEIALAAVQ